MSLSPGSSGTMSSSDSQKADQIAFHFYTKLFYVVNHARTTNPQPAKLDKWFNLETPDSELFTKDAREPYKSISLAPPPPPLEIQVLLAIPELTNNQVLVHVSPDSSRVRIHPTPRYVLLESFVLDFIPGHTPADVPLPTIYKHGIPLFRSLFTLLRILPAWKLHKRLRRRVGGGPSLGITLRVRDGDDPDVLSLMNMSSQSQTHVFPSVPHPMGSLALSATYLTSPTFQLDELESLLSSRFLSLDQRPFTPTLAKNHLRDSSLSSSPPRISSSQSSSGIPLPLPDRTGGAGSLTRQSLGSRPPPRTSLGSIPRQSALAFTPSRPSTSSSSAAAAPSGLTSTRTQLLRNEHEQQLSTSASSLSPTNSFFVTSNVDTTTTTTTATATTATATPPPRRPQLQYPFPFKSNTIASSSSSSPGGLPSSIGGGIPSSLSERIGLDRERVASLPPPLHASRDAGDAGLSHSRGSSLSRGASLSRNTSLRDRGQPRDRSRSRPPDAAPLPVSVPAPVEPGTSPSVPPRKRYSSSFGHRYTGVPGSVGSVGGAGSVGSIASVSGGALVTSGEDSRRIGVVAPHSPLSPSPRHSPSPSSSSNLRPQKRTDDDDISVFVQEIDMRKPLVGRARSGTGTGTGGEQVEGGSAGRPAHMSTSTSPSSPLSSQQPHSSSPLGGQGSQPYHGHGRPHSLSQPYPFHRALTSPPASGHGPLTTITTMTTTTTTTMRAAPIQASSPPGGLMLTSEAEVDERLRRMNEAFLKSLEGLGGSGRPSSSSSASSSSPSNVLRPGLGRAFSERGSGGGAGGNEGNSGRGIGLGLDLGVYGARGAGQGSEEVIGRMEFDGEGEGEGEGEGGGGGEDGSGNGGRRLPLGMTLGNGRGKGASGSGGRFHF